MALMGGKSETELPIRVNTMRGWRAKCPGQGGAGLVLARGSLVLFRI